MRQLALGLIAWVWVVFGGGFALAQQPPTVRQVFLVQNSGWMEPFYRDPRSQFRLMISSLVAQSNLKGVDVTVAAFNQAGQTPEGSPQVLFSGPYDDAKVRAAVQAIDLPRKSSGAYADADFHGALRSTITDILGGREGVIWMITNNKDSPNNSADVVENTRAFYTLLRTSPHITRIYAFPIRDNLSGPNFQEKGFIIYAFAYGARAADALDVILAERSATRALFRSPPVKIKPLEREPVELRLTGAQAGAVKARVNNGALELAHVPGGRPVTLTLTGVLRNTYYPQNIDRAAIAVAWRAEDAALSDVRVALQPTELRGVAAREDSAPITLQVQIPKVSRSGPLLGLLDNGRTLRGTLDIRLEEIEFSLAPDFLQRITAISGAAETVQESQATALMAQQLPAVFLDYRRITSATTSIPVIVAVEHSPWPLILSLALLTALAAGGGFLALWVARPRTYNIPVGGGVQAVSVRPFERRTVSDAYGTRASVTGSMFGPPNVRTLADEMK